MRIEGRGNRLMVSKSVNRRRKWDKEPNIKYLSRLFSCTVEEYDHRPGHNKWLMVYKSDDPPQSQSGDLCMMW